MKAGKVFTLSFLRNYIAGMLLLLGDFTKISPIVEELKAKNPGFVCEVGAYNSPKQTLISGDTEILGIV